MLVVGGGVLPPPYLPCCGLVQINTTDWMAVDSRQFKVWLLGCLIHLFWGTEALAEQTENSGSDIISMTIFVLPG